MLDHGPAAWLGVLALIASIGIGVGACADLDEVELGVCGNHVHEPEFGEDCDGSAARFGPDAKCGAPTSATPCRLTCNPAAAATGCPDGWGCGLDGVCRRPTAELSFVQLPGQARGIGDLDGDGRDDVILRGQSGETQVAFFNENRSLASLFVDPAQRPLSDDPAIQPIVARLTGDGIDDLAVPVIADDISIRVFLGNGTRELANPFVELVTVPFGAAGEVWMQTVFNPTGLPQSVCEIGGCSQSLLLGKTKADETRYAVLLDRELVELFRLADGRKRHNAALARWDQNRPCDLLAVSYRYDESSGSPGNLVDLFSLCTGPGQLNQSSDLDPLGTVAAHSSVSMANAPEQLNLVISGNADIDGDGTPDLLFNAAGDGTTHVLYGRGDGHFNSRADDTGLLDQIDPNSPLIFGLSHPSVPDTATWPRAVADINGDGRADFLLSLGLAVLSTQDGDDTCELAGELIVAGPALGDPAAPQWGYACVLVGEHGLLDAGTATPEQLARNWFSSGSLATPLDLLGNGQLGFAAIDKNKIEYTGQPADHTPPDTLDLLWIDPSTKQLRLQTLIDERIEHVAAGDLDGDRRVDLVIGGEALEVVWGPPFDLARATTLSPAEFDVVQVFDEGRASASLGAERDGRLTIFRDRQWPSLALVEPGQCAEPDDCHVRFAVGALGDAIDFGWALGVVHSSHSSGLRLLRSITGTADLGPAYDAAALPLAELGQLGIEGSAEQATVLPIELDAPTDASAIDEVIVAVRSASMLELAILRPQLTGETGSDELLCSAPFERGAVGQSGEISIVAVCFEHLRTLKFPARVRPYPGAGDPFIEVADADGDGLLDLSWVTINNEVMLLRSHGTGTLSADDLIVLALPEDDEDDDEPADADDPSGPARIDWVRWIELDGTRGRELISSDILGGGRLWGLDVNLDAGTLSPRGSQIIDADDANHLGHRGDFDGDGIDDIALGSVLMFGKAVND